MVVEVHGGRAQVSEEVSDGNDSHQFTGLQVQLFSVQIRPEELQL